MTIFGNSGKTITNAPRGIIGTWANADTWERIKGTQWLYADAGYQQAIAANPTWAVDVGICMIPHNMPVAQFNALMDAGINNAAVSAGGTGMTPTYSVYTQGGAALSDNSPTDGLVFVRPWWEMNRNDWAPYIDRAKFILLWQIWYRLFKAGFEARAKAMGRSHILKVVFSPISDGADFETFYPGDEYVDLVGIDNYASKWGTSTPSAADMLAWTAAFYKKIGDFAAFHGKPVCLPEWGNWWIGDQNGQANSRGRGDFEAYVTQTFDWLAATNAVYEIYYNVKDSANTNIDIETDTPLSYQRLLQRTGYVPPVTDVFRDSFTDTAGVLLGSHVPTIGTAWQRHPATTSASEAISTTGTTRANNVNTSLWTAVGAPASADYTVEADVLFKTLPAGTTIAINGRQSDTATTFYSARYSNVSGKWFITKTLNGVQTNPASVAVAVAAGETHHVALKMAGSTISLYLDGATTPLLSITDTDITAAGYGGFQRTGSSAVGEASGYHLDNFVVHA